MVNLRRMMQSPGEIVQGASPETSIHEINFQFLELNLQYNSPDFYVQRMVKETCEAGECARGGGCTGDMGVR